MWEMTCSFGKWLKYFRNGYVGNMWEMAQICGEMAQICGEMA